MKHIRFTSEGFEKLKDEYADLLRKRPDAVKDLQKAREMGDLSENGYYKAARAKLSSMDARIKRFSLFIKSAMVVDNSGASLVDIGSIVRLTDGKREVNYEIVGDMEANPSIGKLSLLSPLGKALSGKKIGEAINVTVPAGEINFTILDISWP